MTNKKLLFILIIFALNSQALLAKKVLWFTGLPCSGKTTIATNIKKDLPNLIHFDGDIVRKTLNSNLGFSKEDREENLRRFCDLCIITFQTNPLVDTILVTTISPTNKIRKYVKERLEKFQYEYVEVFVKADLNTCIKRDVKGMYKKAISGEIPCFTGISDVYEIPQNPDILCDTDKASIETSKNIVLKFLNSNKS